MVGRQGGGSSGGVSAHVILDLEAPELALKRAALLGNPLRHLALALAPLSRQLRRLLPRSRHVHQGELFAHARELPLLALLREAVLCGAEDGGAGLGGWRTSTRVDDHSAAE